MWIELVKEQMLACIEAGHTDLIDKVFRDTLKCILELPKTAEIEGLYWCLSECERLFDNDAYIRQNCLEDEEYLELIIQDMSVFNETDVIRAWEDWFNILYRYCDYDKEKMIPFCKQIMKSSC